MPLPFQPKPLDADALAKCNGKAGGAVAQVTAAN